MYRTAIADGNFSSSIWEASANPLLEAVTLSSNLSNTTPVYTGTFTAPNTTNKTTGVWLCLVSKPVNRSLIVTLQEATVDTACVATVANAHLNLGWNYVRFPTPYKWTATTAGRYRFKILTDAVAGSSGAICIRASGSTVSFMDSYDSVSTLASTDDFMIGALKESTKTNVTVTITGTGNVAGSGTLKGSSGSNSAQRVGGGACYVADGGTLVWDDTANATLQMRGWMFNNYGTIDMSANTTDRTILAKLVVDVDVTNGDYGINNNGTMNLKSGDLPTPYAEYVSGTGTSASHFTVDRTTDWKVGDLIIVGGDTYAQVERRYIKTVYSTTEFQLSSTSGGAESALTYSHSATQTVSNKTRNCIIEPLNSARSYYYTNYASGGVDLTGCHFNNPSLASGIGGINVTTGSTTPAPTMDYVVLSEGVSNRYGISFASDKTQQTITGIIFDSVNSTNTGSNPLQITSTANKTFNDCMFFEGTSFALGLTTSYNNTFNNCRFNANNTLGAASGESVYAINSGSNTFNNCRFDATRIQALYLFGNSATVFNDCEFGMLGTNTIDVLCVTDSFNDVLFNNCLFGSATTLLNYENQLSGSLIRFHRFQQTNTSHRWYTINGIAYSSGVGLDYTTVATVGSLACAMLPTTLQGLRFEYKVPVNIGEVISIFGKFWCNATALADSNVTLKAELFLPGSLTADQTFTMTKTTDSTSDDAVYRLGLVNTWPVASTATIRLTAINASATAGVEAYVDDLNGGTNLISALDIWFQGQPLAFQLSPQTLGDAAAISTAVWNDAVTYTTGSKGANADAVLSNTDATQAKVDQL